MGDERMAAKSVLWIMALGVIAMIALNAATAHFLDRTLTSRLLEREGRLKQEFLNSLLSTEPNPEALFATPAPSPTMASFARHVKSLPGIVRANIYSPDGFIRHSTDSNLIGVHFGGNPELAAGFEGKITSALETIGSADKSEHLALNLLEGQELIEAYIPVTGPGDKVAAVVEFYRKDDWVRDVVNTVKWTIRIAMAGSALVFALALLATAALRRNQRISSSAR